MLRAALSSHERGDTTNTRNALQKLVRQSLASDVLNDLAVLTMRCGDDEAAVDLLRAVVRLYPDDATAAQNLEALLTQK